MRFSPSLRTPLVRRRRVLGAGRRLLTRLLARRGDVPYRPPSIRLDRSRPSPGTAAVLHRSIGRFWLAVEQPHRAQRRFERAIRGGDIDALVRVGHAVLRGGPTRIVNVQHLGLAAVPAGDADRATSIFRDALTATNSPIPARRGLVAALLQHDRAAEALDEMAGVADLDDLRATALIRSLEQRGAKTRKALQEITPILENHLARRPSDVALRDRLARIHISLLQFDEASRLAAPIPPPSSVAHLAEWTRATSLGEHVRAHDMKLRTAEQLAAAPARRTGSLGELMVRTQAINYRIGPEAALEAVNARWLWIPTETEQRVRVRLHADLALLCGDPEPLRDVARRAPSLDARTQRRFDDAIGGARVLLMGPSPANRPSADVRSAHDVVVTTRRHDPGSTGRTSVAYLNDESFLDTSAEEPDDRSADDRITVLRPSILNRGALSTRPDIRLQPFEDTTPLFGTHFAVQRIIHDLLAHGAATVTLAGLDFFLGEQTYLDGYHVGGADRFASVPFNASHDFAYGFWYTKRLRELGLVDAVPGVAELLDDEVDTYLGRLGRVFL